MTEKSVWDSIKDAEGIISGAIGIVDKVITTLNGSRSAVCTIANATPGTLRLQGSTHSHGGFKTPAPAGIGPGSAGVFSARDAAWSIGTGTEGSVTYSYQLIGYDTVSLTFGWSVPFVGTNDTWDSRSQVHPRLAVIDQTGNGNEKAEMTYSIIDLGVNLYGSIRRRWEQLAGASGLLGWPTTSESDIPRAPGGRYNKFEHGALHFVDGIVHEMHGAIFTSFENSDLTTNWALVTDETPLPDGQGRCNHFQDWSRRSPGPGTDASIYWHPATGAHPVFGNVRDSFLDQGGEAGHLGYPVADPVQSALRITQQFQGGELSAPRHVLVVEPWSPING